MEGMRSHSPQVGGMCNARLEGIENEHCSHRSMQVVSILVPDGMLAYCKLCVLVGYRSVH
jgi:hypothetical protein